MNWQKQKQENLVGDYCKEPRRQGRTDCENGKESAGIHYRGLDVKCLPQALCLKTWSPASGLF